MKNVFASSSDHSVSLLGTSNFKSKLLSYLSPPPAFLPSFPTEK